MGIVLDMVQHHRSSVYECSSLHVDCRVPPPTHPLLLTVFSGHVVARVHVRRNGVCFVGAIPHSTAAETFPAKLDLNTF